MTPGARVAAAIAVLDRWLAGVPVEQGLTNWARGARYAGAKDRTAVRDLVFDVLRARGSAAHLGRGSDGRALILGLLRLQGLDPAEVFTGVGHAPPPLSSEESLAPATPADPGADCPDWLLPVLEAGLGADLPAILARMQERAPLYLRVNIRKATRDGAIAALAQDGITAVADPGADTALLVTSGARKVKSSVPYREGWVEPQDLSVQRAVARVAWAGQTVLDYCAGGGGKSLAIAAQGAARVVAHDADPRRMSDLGERAARAGADIARCTTPDLAAVAPFDVVLCDVPCSGSGTWRRDPETKWRFGPERLAAVIELQARILDEACGLVRPGGQLVYMTCSLIPAENDAQIRRFLDRHPGWEMEGTWRDTPLSASDGFFCAALRAPGP